ncbi:MAG: hypothetical protein M1831_000384 [Alyxoria varia]|nr:MAG: hypothetical protein M1831_000384 [Alyxoria varia]
MSTLACSFPIVVRRIPRMPVPHRTLFLSRHFGTGVLIATAFVHLLPTAFVSLTDPCLPAFWNEGYPAMAGLIAMTSVLVVVGIEMFFASKGAGHVHSVDYDALDEESQNLLKHIPTAASKTRDSFEDSTKSSDETTALDGHYHDDSPRLRGPLTGGARRHHSMGNHSLGHEDAPAPIANVLDGSHVEMSNLDGEDPSTNIDRPESPDSMQSRDDAGTPSDRNLPHSVTVTLSPHPGSQHDPQVLISSQARSSDDQEAQRMLLQCLLLEAGILFHSIFIGMALSVATGTAFVVLLIAISFHQTFEGLALGSRIAAITAFGPGSIKPWLMALAYGTTTPIGQAIGLLVHKLYDPLSEAGLITVGIMNAISSGLLLFAGLVELLAEDFLAEKSYETLAGKKRLEACGAVVAGSFLMAAVGAFA